MATALLTLDLLELGRHKLNLNEYLTLMKFQHDLEHRSFPFVADDRFFPRLILDQFIKEENGIYVLDHAGLRVFGNEEGYFEEFYQLFPNKVDTGFGWRPISTLDPNSQSGKATRIIWDRITKNKPTLQQSIIRNLKRELAHRKASGSMAYLQGIDTWLRQATWEKWEDIPDKNDNSGFKQL
jgi:hypothetical protein